jgi:hypothetical protein
LFLFKCPAAEYGIVSPEIIFPKWLPSMRNSAFMIVLAVACAGSAAPAFAKDKADEQVQAAGSDQAHVAATHEKADKPRKVCKLETVTGSVLPKRICRTVATSEVPPAPAAATKETAQE